MQPQASSMAGMHVAAQQTLPAAGLIFEVAWRSLAPLALAADAEADNGSELGPGMTAGLKAIHSAACCGLHTQNHTGAQMQELSETGVVLFPARLLEVLWQACAQPRLLTI